MHALRTTLSAFAICGTVFGHPTDFDNALKRADFVAGTAGCNALAAAVPNRVFSISSAQYAVEENENQNWSMTNVQTPQCLFEPQSSTELGRGILSLRSTKTQFAIRGGGHMPVPGSSSITNGVLITSSGFSKLEITTDQERVCIGSGRRWYEVYDYLSPYGKVAIGGRFGHVGVPGLLLGGGINYFGNTLGWAMNSVVRFEVVLANGSVVQATKTSHSDLFWALKGGSSNLGIVTHFEVLTYSIGSVFGGLAIYDPSQLDALVNASVAYMDPVYGGIQDLQTAIDPSIGLNPVTQEVSIFSVYFRNSSEANPASLANFTAIPPIVSTVGVRPSYALFVSDTLNPLINTDAYRRAFFSSGLKCNPQTSRLIHDTFWPAVNASGLNATLYYTFQPITAQWAQAARARGGDVIDLDPADGNLMALLFSATWTDPSLDDAVIEFFQSVSDAIVAKAQKLGQSYDFVYLNDAAGSEKPFSTYGKGASLAKLKVIAQRYDPDQVFQTLLPGGFKLS